VKLEVGSTYHWPGSGIHVGLLFVVVSLIDDYRMSDRDQVNKAGYRLLLIEGAYRSSQSGCTLDIAANSAIAVDSRPHV